MIGGALRLKIFAPDGRVARIDVHSPRIDPSAAFMGRTGEEAAALAQRLFSLCPMAHTEAARAATGGVQEEGRGALALLCERLAEMQRASLLDWPGEAPGMREIIALRETLQLLRLIPTKPATDLAAPLYHSGARLGLSAADDFFARQKAAAAADESAMALQPTKEDYLTPADDSVVFAEMAVDKMFGRAPRLPGRCAETGVAARRKSGGGLVARLAAREADMIETSAAIQRLLAGDAPPPGLLTAGLTGDMRYAAVESARGRLYHACRLDGDGRIVDYRIVAPTEWNFHPDGPFVRALLGAEIGVGEAAKRRAERLAFVYDPCIKVEAEVLGSADA